jgi:septin family protein
MRSTPQLISLTKKVMRHMKSMQRGTQAGGVLLAGDPGIGKTTFVNFLGNFLGIKTVTIEVPHVTEEHLINIPFIVFDPATNSQRPGGDQLATKKDASYELVLAKSNLYSLLTFNNLTR